jgi:hypothetical protein
MLAGAAVIGAAVLRSWRLHLPSVIRAGDSGSR